MSPSKRAKIFQEIRKEFGETRLLQVATFGSETTKNAINTACRGYRSEDCPDGIDKDEAAYLSSLVPVERGIVWSLHDVLYGDEEKDRHPVQTFVNEINKYPRLIEIIQKIEGLISRRGEHASGVILYNVDPWETGALMRSRNGDLTTQFSLHDAEQLGDTKFDFLVTEICDKITNAIILLKKDGYFAECSSLRQIYEKYFHPAVLDWKDDKIWDTLATGQIIDLFQFDSDVGGQAIKSILPREPIQMMMANALTRLTGEKGKERPIDRYIRLKNDIQQWYDECTACGLSAEEIKILEPYYLPVSGCPTTQEKLMLLCMEPKLGNFTLKEANAARKICAKKKIKDIPILKEKFINACPRQALGEYVWSTAIEPQMSYSFAEPHALAYSFVAIQIMYLTTYYPIIYWDTACLITNSGSNSSMIDGVVDIFNDLTDEDDIDEEDEEDEDDTQKTTDYGKIAVALGRFNALGIKVLLPDINKSSYTFSADSKNNAIHYGFSAISHISLDICQQIIANRPYSSFADFNSRVKLSKPQILNLLKAGCFDELESIPREELVEQYIRSVTNIKTDLNLRNMQNLIDLDLIPEELDMCRKVYFFNKYLSGCKNGEFYSLSDDAINFITTVGYVDDIIDGNLIKIKVWNKAYQKLMVPLKDYVNNNKELLLQKINDIAIKENFDKDCAGNLSHWEMDSLCYYYHEHELTNANLPIDNFFELPEEPVIINTIYNKKTHATIPIYDLRMIAGTVIKKDKNKNTISLLTADGVVNVKIYKEQFANYSRQISAKDAETGKKKVLEKSWFTRGTLLLVQGIRRGDTFIPKKYNKSFYPIISKIASVDEDGNCQLIYERICEE